MNQRSRLCFILTLISILVLHNVYKNYYVKTNNYSINSKEDNISCHYSKNINNILPLTSNNFNPKLNSIFYHETSCRGGLTSRQVCGIETVARLHPHREIHVLFSSTVTMVSMNKTATKILEKFANVMMWRLEIEDYVQDSELRDILQIVRNSSDYKIEHSSDILRLITLHKYGGTYLDTDFLIVKTLDALGNNWAAGQSDDIVNYAVITITKKGVGHEFVANVIDYIKENYNPHLWSATTGPIAVTMTMARFCKNIHIINLGIVCDGFIIYDSKMFYPISFSNSSVYFKKGPLVLPQPVFGYHYWNKLSANTKVEKDSPFDVLAREHCPVTYDIYGYQLNT